MVLKGVPMALKIVYQICCGIDVHKTFVVACIASTNKQGVTTYKRHRFSTFTQGLKELLQWLLDNHCKDVCMESTGKYWIPIYNVLKKIATLFLLILNMLRLSVERKLSWAGLTPTNNESAGKKKSVRVSKAGCYIKPLLVYCIVDI